MIKCLIKSAVATQKHKYNCVWRDLNQCFISSHSSGNALHRQLTLEDQRRKRCKRTFPHYEPGKPVEIIKKYEKGPKQLYYMYQLRTTTDRNLYKCIFRRPFSFSPENQLFGQDSKLQTHQKDAISALFIEKKRIAFPQQSTF